MFQTIKTHTKTKKNNKSQTETFDNFPPVGGVQINESTTFTHQQINFHQPLSTPPQGEQINTTFQESLTQKGVFLLVKVAMIFPVSVSQYLGRLDQIKFDVEKKRLEQKNT